MNIDILLCCVCQTHKMGRGNINVLNCCDKSVNSFYCNKCFDKIGFKCVYCNEIDINTKLIYLIKECKSKYYTSLTHFLSDKINTMNNTKKKNNLFVKIYFNGDHYLIYKKLLDLNDEQLKNMCNLLDDEIEHYKSYTIPYIYDILKLLMNNNIKELLK